MNLSMSGRDSRAWVEVDLAAVIENARTVAQAAGTRLLPVVKANAYGVGAVAVSRALETVDPWGYGVATVDEGAELRAAGITRPVLVLTPGRPEWFDGYRAHRLTPSFEDAAVIRAWRASGGGFFHVEIDTGMSRSGVRWDAVESLRDVLDTPDFEAAFTQFHSADRADDSAERQRERFLESVGRLPRRPALLHAANSAASLRDRQFAFDMVRPGIYLYCGSTVGQPQGRQVVSLRSRVVSVRPLRRGETVSYGASWMAPQDTTVATLGIGYADGVRRCLGGRAHVLLRGRVCPIVGVVTMDLTMVDAGDRPVAVGDVATLIGEDGGRRITVQDVAGWAKTITYEVLTGLGPRLPRIYG
ncbi:MAG: alanine racemase [Gemmatimonadetes bacterium]|nr:alanine racemase [Gemmatimonadota bacterium]